MKYFSIQRLGNYSQDDRELRVSEDVRATVGAAADAGLQLRTSLGLPAVCLEVWQESGKCLAENVSRNPRLIMLNGTPLYSVGQLEHGDLLEIGSDQFAVVYQDETPAEVVVPTAPPVEVEPPRYVPGTSLNSMVLNAAVARHEPQDSAWDDVDVLRHLAEEFGAFLFANFRHAKARFPKSEGLGDDLFQHAPDEVREIYSLHAIGDVSVEQKLEIFGQLNNHDAVVWVVPEDDMKTCLENAKIHLAWFARPNVLEMTLRQSPVVFSEALLKPFKAIVLRPTRGADWVIYTTAGFDLAGLRLDESVAAMA